MQVIHWPELQPPPADLDALSERLRKALPLRSVCQALVEITLRAYPWKGRADLIPCYHPSQTYRPGQRLALLIASSQKARPVVWLLAQVKAVRDAENPVQGRFQVLTLDIEGRQIQMAAGIANATYPELDLSKYSAQHLARLEEWVLDTYATSLRMTARKLIHSGALRGRLTGEIFLPEQASALAPEVLDPLFARLSPDQPWIPFERIVKGLPDLSPLGSEAVARLLRATLKENRYRHLGGDRWTTQQLFQQLHREVPYGLPIPFSHSKTSTWTKQDQQDLSGYDSQFLPAEARQALDGLGIVERPGGTDALSLPGPWRPPQEPLRLPALSTLQITQGYFPVGTLMSAFAPDVELVYLQLMHGEHQPFLLDRDHGLLKALRPEELHTRIVEEDIPAGTYLWLDYQGNERYRIATRPLPFKRRAPCKLAYLEAGKLHIEDAHTSMQYAGDPALFQAKIGREQLLALFAEQRSVREAIAYAVQEISATDPDHRAHWSDIFNAVFLQRICSPTSVALLLYTHPCFEPLGGGKFRYKPMPDTTTTTPKKTDDRLSQLWDDLLADRVPPRPLPGERLAARPGREVSYPVAPSYAPEAQRPPRSSPPEIEPGVSIRAGPYDTAEDNTLTKTVLKGLERLEAFLLSDAEPELLETLEGAAPASEYASEPFTWLPDEQAEPDEATPPPEAISDTSIESVHEASLSFSTPFRWDPRPAWINPAGQSGSAVPHTPDPRSFVSRPKIPLRPFHKQRFHRRAFFYLRSWLSRTFRRSA